jgi:hypothetical protein
MVVRILKVIAALSTIATGVVSLLRPRAIKGFTGLEAPGSRGVTEIRAVLGGFFVALGLAPLIFRASSAMYLMLGFTYLVVAVVRAVSMVVDRSVERSNLISVAVEIVLGIVLVL